MIFLIDTTTLSDLMRGQAQAVAHLAQLSLLDQVVVCTIVWGEIRYGIERLPPGKRRQDLEAKAAGLLASLACTPVPEGAADHYGRIKAASRAKGLPVDENDLWIAATALALGATLVSRDSDFGSVDGLVVTDWSR